MTVHKRTQRWTNLTKLPKVGAALLTSTRKITRAFVTGTPHLCTWTNNVREQDRTHSRTVNEYRESFGDGLTVTSTASVFKYSVRVTYPPFFLSAKTLSHTGQGNQQPLLTYTVLLKKCAS